MDENLMPIQTLWDPEVQEAVRSKVSSFKRSGKKVDKEGYLQDIEGVYHAIGGFARLAHTANEDPKWFYNRFGDRLLPNIREEHDVNITILPALPRSALDGEVEVIDGQHNGVLPGMRGGDEPRDSDFRDLHGVRGGDELPLDQGGNRASRSPAQGIRSSGGGENSSQQDDEGLPFE